jgi:D-alanyl-lipoteichoic acid acyltransferase DltB (MBOAT superfamily)
VVALATTNLAFAALTSTLRQLVTLLGFLLGSWLLLQVAGQADPQRRSSGWFRLALALPVLLLFIGHKLHGIGGGADPTWLPTPLAGLTFLGLAYAVMRYFHVAVDICEEGLQPPGLVEYVAFVQPWFMALVGPIQRLQHFRASADQPLAADRLEVARQVERIARGLVKIAVVRSALAEVAFLPHDGWAAALLLANLLLIGLYLDFSGYCDLAVGLGRLCGWDPPENFKAPWRARNLTELWSRWHISLSEWSRDYVFTPLLRILTKRRVSPLARAGLCYLASMTVLGMWHEISGRFLLFGAMHGTGLWLCKAWEVILRRRFGPEGLKRYQSLPAVRILAKLVTWQWVALSLLVVRGALWEQVR